MAAAAVAVGWSEYVNQLLDNLFGVQIPEALSNAPEQGGVFNLPAVLLVVMCALLLIRGGQRVGEDQRRHGGDQDRRLLHSSPVPVALATRGFRTGDIGRVTRLTTAYTGTAQSDQLVRAVRAMARRLGATLRLASFAVRLGPPETARFSAEAAGLVAEWTANIQASARRVLEEDPESAEAIPGDVQFVIGHGHDWEHALEDVEWRDGDVLVIGSSDAGPVAQVFLGSRAAKIVRHSPVPVLTFPRGVAKTLSQD